MQREYEGFGRATKEIFQCKEKWRSGICGAVAQILSVPDQYIIAVEIALANSLQHVVTKNDEVARQAIDYLKTHNLGRVTFLPLNTIRVMRPREFETRAASSPGAIGFAAGLIHCEAEYRPIVDYLLGRTIVAENIDAAIRIAKQYSFAVKIVTLEGELINPGGAIAGGSLGRRDTSYLGRKNVILQLESQIGDLERNLFSLRESGAELQGNLQLLENEYLSIHKKLQEAEVRQAELAVHIDQTMSAIAGAQLSISTVEKEMLSFHTDYENLQVNYCTVANKIKELENRDSEHKSQVLDLQQYFRQLQEKRDRLNETVTEIKVSLSAIQQEIKMIEDNCQRLDESNEQFAARLQQLDCEYKQVTSDVAKNRNDISFLSETRGNLAAQVSGYKTEQSELFARKISQISVLQKTDKEIKEMRRKLNDIQARLHEMRLISTKYDYEVEYCLGQLHEQFTLQLDEAYNYFREGDYDSLTTAARKIEQEIAQLGPVNPTAIEEYEKLQQRYNFLHNQYKDLMTARTCLSSIIQDIDKTMSRQFKAAFGKIDSHFADIFAQLFAGGKAQLQLTDSQNVLESGIEIMVQPPGKKQQNLALISGGERALTVIALLFAFLRFRPTSFCVLDEIDAALDEANVQRFGEFLREYGKETQFIVITHRKGTMEIADVLYGITMEEAGVSKMISVKFMDKAG